jgi:hypothetical protein
MVTIRSERQTGSSANSNQEPNMLTPLQKDGRNDRTVRAILVSRLRAIYDSLVQLLSAEHAVIGWETSPQRAVATARAESCPVLLITAECDWRFVVEAFGTSADRPNVIVLLPEFDTGLWVLGYDAGAFDVLPMDVDGESLTNTLLAAQQRWERRQLVCAARAQNPMAPSVLG